MGKPELNPVFVLLGVRFKIVREELDDSVFIYLFLFYTQMGADKFVV